MMRGFLVTLLGLLAGAAGAAAQLPQVLQDPKEVVIVMDPTSRQSATDARETSPAAQALPAIVGPDDVFWSAPPAPCSESCPQCRQRVWFNADYLLWWINHAPIRAPLVTTGSPLDPVPGALGQKNTTVLFGNEAISFGVFNGVRLYGGFDLGEGWTVEGGFFGLERRAVASSFNSDGTGTPVIARPYVDGQTGVAAAYLDAFPGQLTGSAAVAYRTRLLGYELNMAVNAYRDDSLRFEVLAGFRALELNEDLQIIDNVAALVPGQLVFTGTPADPPNSLTIFDHYHNYNHFWGGQVGGQLHWQANALNFGITGKLALGATQELAILDSSTNLNSPGAAPTPNPGGVLVQPSNALRFYQSRFAYVPELALEVGYWVTPYMRLEVGYQFLYWSEVARPGSEMDLTVNPAQVPRDPRFGNGLGDARPAFQFHQSDFWAQGFHFGFLVQY